MTPRTSAEPAHLPASVGPRRRAVLRYRHRNLCHCRAPPCRRPRISRAHLRLPDHRPRWSTWRALRGRGRRPPSPPVWGWQSHTAPPSLHNSYPCDPLGTVIRRLGLRRGLPPRPRGRQPSTTASLRRRRRAAFRVDVYGTSPPGAHLRRTGHARPPEGGTFNVATDIAGGASSGDIYAAADCGSVIPPPNLVPNSTPPAPSPTVDFTAPPPTLSAKA